MAAGKATKRAFRRAPGEKRQRILSAARSCFSVFGFEGSLTAEIARIAGVSEGTIFHHFGCKRKLLEAVAREDGRALAEATIAWTSRSAEPRLEEMLVRAFEHVQARGVVLLLPRTSDDAAIRAIAYHAMREEVVDAASRALESWSDRGFFRPMNAPLTAELLFSLVGELMLRCFRNEGEAQVQAYIREAASCIQGAVSADLSASDAESRGGQLALA